MEELAGPAEERLRNEEEDGLRGRVSAAWEKSAASAGSLGWDNSGDDEVGKPWN